jgi:hypothetical protein
MVRWESKIYLNRVNFIFHFKKYKKVLFIILQTPKILCFETDSCKGGGRGGLELKRTFCVTSVNNKKNQHVIPFKNKWAVPGEGNMKRTVLKHTKAEAIE